MNISQEFAPPYKLVIPYFLIGSVFYLISIVYTFVFDVSDLQHLDSRIFAWVHLYLLGFLMMVIFGAMAQLLPVILSVGHFGVELFYVIWPLLAVGTLLMVGGFLFYPALLPYGGTVILISMLIFIFDIYMTLKRVESFNLAVSTVFIANTSLLIGIIVGIIMALGYAGQIDVDITALLKAHVYLVVGGYIVITIMGLSMILIPMFGLSHNFSQKPVGIAVSLVSLSIVLVLASVLFEIDYVAYAAYGLIFIGMCLYLYQIGILYKKRARKIQDIYSHSMMLSYGSLLVSIFFGIGYFIFDIQKLLIVSMWLIFGGFFGFLVSGHLYKIVPFLVWFEKFSPLVGKQKVPMLAQMVPDRAAYIQVIFTAIGLLLSIVGLLISNTDIFRAGVSFMSMGALFFIYSLIYILNYKG